MHIEILTEELSAEKALYELVPKMLGNEITFKVHSHQGKSDLLRSLRGRLTGYSYWLPDDWRIVVLVDEDREDCHELKFQLETVAVESGLVTKSRAAGQRFQVVNRIAIEELEAWFLGDLEAVRAAFPRLSRGLLSNPKYANPDHVPRGTWETLERILQRAGYYKAGMAKTDAALRIATHMVPDRNRSRSFQVFMSGLMSANA